MGDHSPIGPSSLSRVIACPGSVAASAAFLRANPDAARSSPFAAEGTLAHDLCEILLKNPDYPPAGMTHKESCAWVENMVRGSEDFEHVDQDMVDYGEMLYHAKGYRNYCLDHTREGDITLIEAKVYMADIDPLMYGRNDYSAIHLDDMSVDVIDLKYGKGVTVSPDRNPQGMAYAQGVREFIRMEYGIEINQARFHIYQPRALTGFNVGFYEMSGRDLDQFVGEVRVAINRSRNMSHVRIPGETQCRFCSAKDDCEERADWILKEYAAMKDWEGRMSNEKRSRIANALPIISKWADEQKSRSTEVALSGEKIEGMKLVEGRPMNVLDEDAVRFVIGDEVALKPPAVRSKTALVKELGKERFDQLLGGLMRKVPGRPILVPENDPRPEYTSGGEAIDMLEDLD